MCDIPKETQDFAKKQWNQAKGEQPSVTCECGASMPLRFTYRCLYCGMFLCRPCAEIHFGKTVAEYWASKAPVDDTDLFFAGVPHNLPLLSVGGRSKDSTIQGSSSK